MNRFVLCITLAALLGLAGCGSKDCKSMCEDYKGCASATAEDKALDCAKICTTGEAAAAATNCTAKYNAYIDCRAGLDTCTVNDVTKCTAEAKAFEDCMTPASN